MTAFAPLLKKESQYSLDKESIDINIQMDTGKQNLVNALPNSGSGVSLTSTSNSKHSSIAIPPPSPKLNKNEKRHSKRLSRLSQQISMQTKYISTQRPKVKRWKLYEGKSRLFCHGRIVTGNDNLTFFLSTFLIIGPCVLFMVFILPEFSSIYIYLFAYLTAFSIASLLKTSWTDPGILPRNLEPLPHEVYLNNSNSNMNLPESAYNSQSPFSSTSSLEQSQNTLGSTYPFISPVKTFIPPMRNIVVNGRIVGQKFCDTCKIYRPPRSFHCSFCDNCVENCDHHCPWIANCIGKRNYRYFYAFITSCSLICIVVFIGSLSSIIKKMRESKLNYDFDGLMQCLIEKPIPFILFFIVVFVGWSVTFLSGYHTYLIFKNITTHEQLKEQYIPNTNKSYFSTGNMFKNMVLVLCRPVPPARYAMRQYVSIPVNNNNDSNSPITNPFLTDPSPSTSNNNDSYNLNIIKN